MRRRPGIDDEAVRLSSCAGCADTSIAIAMKGRIVESELIYIYIYDIFNHGHLSFLAGFFGANKKTYLPASFGLALHHLQITPDLLFNVVIERIKCDGFPIQE